MKIKKITIISLLLIATSFVAAISLQAPSQKEKVLVSAINEILNTHHYATQSLNEDFSARMYDSYMKSLDYSKMYFTEQETSILDSYKNALHKELRTGEFTFFELSVELITAQVKKVASYCTEILSAPFDYEQKGTLELDEKKRGYAKNDEELKQLWHNYLKVQVMDEIILAEKQQETQKKNNDTVQIKSFAELEISAREKVQKRYETRFKRMNKIDRTDRFNSYINSFTGVFDPHTNFFPPKDKQDFDISMSGQLEGIGATLSERDGFIKVVEIVPGSPSWKQGDLKPDYVILKVAQGDNEPVDIVDMRLDEAVRLIRGPKGTKVILTVKKIDGEIILIPIIRDVIVLEEKYAKSAILSQESSENTKVGYIYLPQFYVDMNSNKGRRCADDMKKEIKKLSQQNVAGIIIDLRDNGGGSLGDVIDIGGFFIDKGPIVQVQSTGGQKRVLTDNAAGTEYDGPLIIIVNSFSASASEILAAAMQDYKRAIIVGTKSTYGKGTVQRFVDIDQLINNQYRNLLPLGAVKVTIQKFYRINGGSTQLKGVIPDIILPDIYQSIDMGEKELDFAMEWDKIPKANYTMWQHTFNVEKLAKKSAARIKKDTSFIKITESADWLAERRNATQISVSYADYKSKKAADALLSEKYSNAGKSETLLTILPFEEQKTTELLNSEDSIKHERTEKWYKELKEDVELYETYRIMQDLIADYK